MENPARLSKAPWALGAGPSWCRRASPCPAPSPSSTGAGSAPSTPPLAGGPWFWARRGVGPRSIEGLGGRRGLRCLLRVCLKAEVGAG